MALLTKAALLSELDVKLPANNTGAITPAEHKALLRDIIDSSAAGIGSAVRSRLQFHPLDGWVPVSDVTTMYLIVNRSDSFANLAAAIVAHLTAGGSSNAFPNLPALVEKPRTGSYATIGGANTSGLDAMLDDLWPLNADPPFVWLCSPAAFGWLERSRANISTRVDNTGAGAILEDDVSFGRVPYEILIDDTHYEVGRYRTQLARPVDVPATDGEAAFRVQYRYSPAPARVPVVTQVVP